MARRPKQSPGPYLLHLDLVRERIVNPELYPFNLPALRNLDRLRFHPKVTFLVGENGSGKSTILEAIALACGINPEGGSINFRFSTRESHSSLESAVRLARLPATPGDRYFLRAESYFNVATEIERLDAEPGFGPPIIDAYGSKSLHEQSHGESFFALFRHRFRNCGLYLLDEPEAALSPVRQLTFLALLHDYVRRGCQFVVATHSPIILAYPDAVILVLSPEGIRETPYRETEHYTVTRGFLNNTESYLRDLLSDPGETAEDHQ
jgi:predicted ATPase